MAKKHSSFTKLFTTLAFVFFIASVVSYQISSSKFSGAASKPVQKSDKKDEDVYKMLELFGKAFEITKDRYVDEVENKKLIEGAIDGMLSKLDPHSSFLNEDDFNSMNEQTSGSFGGLGIEVTMDKGVIKVISPLDDSPAFKAGVEAGDLITHIDDVQVQGLSLQEAIKRMKGKPGTKVKLKIFRENSEPLDIIITRDIIRTEPVKSKVKADGNVGYIRLSTFNENSYDDMAKAIKKIKSDNPKVLGFILDLRNNTGGLLDQAVKISDAFLNEGEIVSIMSRQENASRVFFASEGDILDNKPLVVIINGASASAAEIVAGALQDHRRAVLIGTKSYGKGSVQTLIPLGDTALKITTARYYTPSGRSIQADGIEPDVEVNRAKIEEVKEDRMFSEETLTNALKNDTKDKSGKKDAKSEREKTEEERDKNDYQLNRAVDMVKALAVYGERFAEKPAKKPAPKTATNKTQTKVSKPAVKKAK
ncbi:MAG: S41 family peptidase [Alphaproteobacteria bacterium]|nr:S41 family peptidase [Alphaproteobacteria bacterium]